MSDPVSYRPAPGEIPTQPGVYRFRNQAGRVLYVGKAKNLRARLSNYFGPLESLHERTRRMVTTANSVEWTIVGSELEALQLEYTWIKEFDPPYNVQFRDDKSYPYLAVTMSEPLPRVMISRGKRTKGNRYLGPYVKVGMVRDTIDEMLRVFPVRSCSAGTLKRAQRTGKPCLLGDIGKCAAPCVGRVSEEEHRAIAKDFLAFMSGNDQTYIRQLRQKMLSASEHLEYEQAARYRDQIEALETVLERSAVVLPETTNADVFGLAEDELTAAVQVFSVRQGRIRGVRGWVVDKELAVTAETVLADALRHAYGQEAASEIPSEVIVPVLPDSPDAVASWLTELHGSRVVLKTDQRGQKASVTETANANAHDALRLYRNRRSADYTVRSQALAEIQQALQLDEAPLRIECFDVSHLGGQQVVGSMVVFEDGLPKKSHYRKFHIDNVTDDTAAISQIVSRRLARLDAQPTAQTQPVNSPTDTVNEGATKESFAYPPNLLIVDGGAPQVSAAVQALTDAGRTDIAVCGMAKRLEEIWQPGEDYPIILRRNSEALFLLQRIRDEAHRFAITFQRNTRSKKMQSELAQVHGLGQKRAQQLLIEFGSLSRLKQASLDDLLTVPGIGEKRAEQLAEWLRSHEN